jgi:hypothetical protein
MTRGRLSHRASRRGELRCCGNRPHDRGRPGHRRSTAVYGRHAPRLAEPTAERSPARGSFRLPSEECHEPVHRGRVLPCGHDLTEGHVLAPVLRCECGLRADRGFRRLLVGERDRLSGGAGQVPAMDTDSSSRAPQASRQAGKQASRSADGGAEASGRYGPARCPFPPGPMPERVTSS